MKRIPLTAILALLSLSLAPLSAAGLKILPAEISLTGPQSSQRLLVLAEENGKVIGDHTSLTRFESSDEAVAKIDSRGVVRAIGDGEATVTARQDGKSATVTV